jgi:phage terminase small subunit
MTKLKHKQAKFVAEFLAHANATEAAIRAGYSPRSARSTASRLLTKANIAAAVADAQRSAAGRAGISADAIVRELRALGFANLRDILLAAPDGDLSRLTAEQAAALREVKVEETIEERGEGGTRTVRRLTFKLSPKLPALAKLGDLIGLFSAKLGKKEQALAAALEAPDPEGEWSFLS